MHIKTLQSAQLALQLRIYEKGSRVHDTDRVVINGEQRQNFVRKLGQGNRIVSEHYCDF